MTLPEIRQRFASNFRKALDYARINGTHKEAGKELGVSAVMIHNYKAGKKMPSIEKAVEIATRCGVCVDWLLTGRGPKTPGVIRDDKLSEVIIVWEQLSEDTRNAITAIVAANAPAPEAEKGSSADRPTRLPKHLS